MVSYLLVSSRIMKIDLRVPDEFPSFSDWPDSKIDFMNFMMPVLEEPHDFEMSEDEVSDIHVPFVVATEDLYENNPDGTCSICNLVLKLDFRDDIDEWVYIGCVNVQNIVMHDQCSEVSKI